MLVAICVGITLFTLNTYTWSAPGVYGVGGKTDGDGVEVDGLEKKR